MRERPTPSSPRTLIRRIDRGVGLGDLRNGTWLVVGCAEQIDQAPNDRIRIAPPTIGIRFRKVSLADFPDGPGRLRTGIG